MMADFEGEKVKPCFKPHCAQWVIAICNWRVIQGREEPVTYSRTSSAYKEYLTEEGITVCISLMDNKNRRPLRTPPCGTPSVRKN